MKKCTTMLLALVAALLLLPGMARAEDASGTCGEGLTWTLEGGVLSIEGNGTMEDYATSAAPWYSYRNEIQSIQIGDGVTTIGDWAFFNCSQVTDVIVPEGVTFIGESAFESCRGMVSISLPDSLREIPNDWRNHYGISKSAFKNCRSLTTITIPDGVTSIPESAFEECVNLVSIDIPDSVTVIWLYAFQGCSSLKEVRIPDSVTTLWGYSFRGCTSLERVTISDHVTEIQGGMFYDCTSLSSINIPDNVTHIGAYAFNGCRSLEEIDIPDRVASIEFGAFKDCSSLTSVILPDSVSTIEQSTFSGCTSLTQVTIPDSVITIDDYAFLNCRSLTDITIPDSVTEIGLATFESCASLTSVTIPDSVKEFGLSVFKTCTNLVSVTMCGNIAELGDYTFTGCGSLTQVTIPDSITKIGHDAFYNCNSLADVFYSGSKEKWEVVTIDTQWGGNAPLFRAIIHCSDGDIVPVRGVTLNTDSLELVVGESVTLTAEIDPANADNKNLIWNSSYPDIASVDENGTVTALKYGYTRITVETEEGGYTAQCTVGVSDIPTYWVTFDSGRGYGYMSEAQVQKGKTYTLPECTFTAPNKMEFDCWEIGGKQYQPGDRITVTDDVTVSALWKDAPAEVYTVTFLSNGGTGTMAPVEIEEGSPCTLPACAFTAPEGKAFDHWEIDGRAYVPGNAIAVTGNVSVRAVWKKLDTAPVTCTVTFLSNGGAGTMAPVEIEEGSPYTLPACAFTAPEGKAFDHWEIGGRTYHPGDRISVTGDITVRAVYAAAQSGPAFTFEFDFSQVDMSSGTLTINIVVYMNNIYLLTIPVVLNLA